MFVFQVSKSRENSRQAEITKFEQGLQALLREAGSPLQTAKSLVKAPDPSKATQDSILPEDYRKNSQVVVAQLYFAIKGKLESYDEKNPNYATIKKVYESVLGNIRTGMSFLTASDDAPMMYFPFVGNSMITPVKGKPGEYQLHVWEGSENKYHQITFKPNNDSICSSNYKNGLSVKEIKL